jgi:DNA polymerase type B, organellar and viral
MSNLSVDPFNFEDWWSQLSLFSLVAATTATNLYRKRKKNELGQFVGVYYSKELKYARDLSYQIIPLRGYLFEKMSSSFESFVLDLFARRQDTKIKRW